MEVRLTNRLRAVASQVPVGARLADIGTDHALLPVYLMLSGRILYAVATDVRRGPFEAAQRTVDRFRLAHRIEVRLGDGLHPVVAGEVDTLVLAGMGGATMREILRRAPEVVAECTRVIVQPMNAAEQIRKYLMDVGLHLDHQEIVAEEGRLYDVDAYAAVPHPVPDPVYAAFSASDARLEAALRFGPMNLMRHDALTVEKVMRTLARWREMLRQMEVSGDPAAVLRRARLTDICLLLEAWLDEPTRLVTQWREGG